MELRMGADSFVDHLFLLAAVGGDDEEGWWLLRRWRAGCWAGSYIRVPARPPSDAAPYQRCRVAGWRWSPAVREAGAPRDAQQHLHRRVRRLLLRLAWRGRRRRRGQRALLGPRHLRHRAVQRGEGSGEGGDGAAGGRVQCTHLVVQNFAGRKFERALKHGPRNGLFLVTLGWFVDCVRRSMRLDESLYVINNIGENGLPLGEFNRFIAVPVDEKSCLPPMIFQDKACSDATRKHPHHTPRKENGIDELVFMDDAIYIDPSISGEMKKKISAAAIREGAKLLEHWFIGCPATYVVCEDASIKRYVGHSDNIVTPLWILKTVKKKTCSVLSICLQT